MKNLYSKFIYLFLLVSVTLQAQQLPNSSFEDWSGTPFDGHAQPKSWNYSNVTQLGLKFNFAQQAPGRSGYCMKVEDQDLGAAGITETSPGYISLGQPWVYIESLFKVSEATAGTTGGISWGFRPDTMAVWIKRTGNRAMDEDFNLVYYAWTGTAQSDKYKGKNNDCTSVSKTDEESDIRISTDGNECGTTTAANQVAEGWVRQRAIYDNWTLIKVPIFYVNDAVPEKMNVIFSASNYPNFRANSGLYAGNTLFIDDAQLIYSSKIQQLYIDGNEWKKFNPNTSKVQYYVVEDEVTSIPSIKAYRGAGQLTNSKNVTTKFMGRQLKGSEITIEEGVIDQTPTTITVRAEDGSSTTTYQILFMHKASNNAKLDGIQAGGQEIRNFNQNITDYTLEVPYGGTLPIITVTLQEEGQTVELKQATSISDVTTITVTAPDHTTTNTYTIRYKAAPLSDNTLKGISVNGTAITGFLPTKANYIVNLPLGTTEIPTVVALSNYPEGMQTIQMTPPDTIIEGSKYMISITTPGNAIPMVYQLQFHLVQSSNCQLQAIFINGEALEGFSPENKKYQVNLPTGTTAFPQVTYTKGDAYQTVEEHTNQIAGTTRLIVTAISGNRMVYTITFINAPTPDNILKAIHIAEIDSTIDLSLTSKRTFSVDLPYGTTTCSVSYTKNYVEQTVLLQAGGINQPTILSVYPNTTDGQPAIYTIIPQVVTANPTYLNNIKVDGASLTNFSPNRFTYIVNRDNANTVPTVDVFTSNDVAIQKTTDLWHTTITVGNASDTSTYQLYYHYPNDAIPNGEFTQWTKTAKTSSYKPTGWNATNDYVGKYDAEDYVTKSTASIVELYSKANGTLDWQWSNYQAAPAVINLANMTASQIVSGGSRTNVSGTVAFRNTPDVATINYKMIEIDADNAGGLFQFKFEDSEGQLHTINHVESTTQTNFSTKTLSLNLDGKHIRAYDVIVDASSATLHGGKGAHGGKMQVDYIRFAYNNTLTSVFVNGKPTTRSGNNFSIILPSSLDTDEPKLTFVGEVSDQAQSVAWQEPQVEGAFSVRKATIINYGEDGLSSTYYLTVRRPLDTNTTLKSITIGGKPLSGFTPSQVNYTYSMPYDAETMPDIAAELQNNLQKCLVSITHTSATIQVQSEAGDVRTYTINFVFSPTLSMLAYNHTNVTNFEEDQYNYVVQLKQNETMWPAISYIKSDSNLMVDVTYIDSLATAFISVTSSDHSLRNTYSLTFLPYLSNNARLKDLQISGCSLPFYDTVFIYDNIELSSLKLPSIIYTLAEATQTAVLDTIYSFNSDSSYCNIVVSITVTAEDQLSTEKYTLQFEYFNPNTFLKNIFVDSHPLDTTLGFTENFSSEQYDYYITYPIGTNPNKFITATQVFATAYNPNASVAITTNTIQTVYDTLGNSVPIQTNIYIIVQADNHNRTYTIHQKLLLDSLNQATELLVANQQGTLVALPQFHPNEYYYEYTLADTRNSVPDFTLRYSNTSSLFAYISYDRGNNFRIVDASDETNYAFDYSENDPCYRIYYKAEDGTKYTYKIKFRRSEIKRAQKPMEGDVLIQPIPGSSQIAVASLRANVVFGLYDLSGRMVELVKLPESDPNSFVTTTDGFGQTYFGHLTDFSSCTILSLEPNKIYFWIFSENGKRKIKSGKITLLP